MRQIVAILLATVMVALNASPRQGLGARSRFPMKGQQRVGAFVTVNKLSSIDSLVAAGVEVHGVTGNVATVSMTSHQLHEVASMSGVNALDVAHRLWVTNDSARYYSHCPEVENDAQGANVPFTGKGVIVGMIDSGVDFNHINLCDEQGRSRVIAAYLPADERGVSPMVDGFTLPGSHYDTPEQIALLTTDNPSMSHGTHTTGTAAGSYKGNGLHGVAPDAHLVICAMPDSQLTDVNIANSVRYIFDVAKRHNMPAVINMSLGSEEGPHDGTSMLCRLFDELSGPGRICVVSAANDGHRKHVIDHTFEARDTLYTTIAPYGDAKGWTPGYVSMWSLSEKKHTAIFTAVSKSTGKTLYSWKVPQLGIDDDAVVLDGKSDPVFAQFFSDGSIKAANAKEDCNGHYHTMAEINVKPANDDIVLGFKMTAGAGERVCAWAGNGLVFTRSNIGGMSTGMTSMSINDIATGDSAISVGAYCTRRFIPLEDGTKQLSSRAVLEDIAYFSGFGPDVRGIARPDLVAPGYVLVSSANRYDTVSTVATGWRAPGVTVDGVYYPYASQYGTSMSTPVVTGTIALCLEIKPDLSPREVREMLIATSVRDDYVIAGDAARWGAGKLDINAAIKYVQHEASVDAINTGNITVAPNPCNGDFAVAGIGDNIATVTLLDMQGRAVATTTVCGDSRISMSDVLDSGIYIVVVSAGYCKKTTKLIVKH